MRWKPGGEVAAMYNYYVASIASYPISLEPFCLRLYPDAGVGHVAKNVLLIVQDSMHEIQ